MAMRKTNETYEVTVSSPLVRPGLTITTRVSKKYLVPTLHDLLEQVRQFNQEQGAAEEKK